MEELVKVVKRSLDYGQCGGWYMLEAKHWALREEQLPDLYAIFPTLMDEPDVVQHYPPAPRKPDWDDDCVYIHSSGSTGHPKPIPQAHRQVLDWCTSGAWLAC